MHTIDPLPPVRGYVAHPLSNKWYSVILLAYEIADGIKIEQDDFVIYASFPNGRKFTFVYFPPNTSYKDYHSSYGDTVIGNLNHVSLANKYFIKNLHRFPYSHTENTKTVATYKYGM